MRSEVEAGGFVDNWVKCISTKGAQDMDWEKILHEVLEQSSNES
jgi:hypothetical protein